MDTATDERKLPGKISASKQVRNPDSEEQTLPESSEFGAAAARASTLARHAHGTIASTKGSTIAAAIAPIGLPI